ncbi:MAG: hypothetical protein QXU18_05460 [Thermoplasmatales archaeon]
MEPVRIPVTEQLHKGRRRVVVVSIVVTIVTVSVFLGLSLNTVATVNVMGVEVHVHYAGIQQGYFGNAFQNFTWNVKTLDAGEIFHFTLTITNSANSIHSIQSIVISTVGFSLLSSGVKSPFNVAPHSTQELVLTIKSPNYGYVGTIVINILAS